MAWKKIIDTKDLVAYEKHNNDSKVRIEARSKKASWLVYKTYNFPKGDDWISYSREYVANSFNEAKELIKSLMAERDMTLSDIGHKKEFSLNLKRIYKEDYMEKWRFSIDQFTEDNFVLLHYGEEIMLDIVMHDRYNIMEREIADKLIDSLGIKDLATKIRYDFFYYTKHSAKKRIYQGKEKPSLVAKVEFTLDPAIDNEI